MTRVNQLVYAFVIVAFAISWTAVPPTAHAAPPPQLVVSPHVISNVSANTRITYSVNTVDMPTFNAYDIEVVVNGCSPKCSVINPLSITLGNFLPPSLVLNECINGVCSSGTPSSTDGPGVVHVAIGSSSFAMNNGTLFSITYNTTSSVGGTPLLFQNDFVSDPNGSPIHYTDINGIYGVVHDVAVTAIVVSRNFAYVGIIAQPIKVNVTVANLGTAVETFKVNATANATLTHSTPIGTTQNVTNLAVGASTVVTLNWNTTLVVRGIYILSAQASMVPGETDLSTSNNQLQMSGIFQARKCGDIDNDGTVDITDLVAVWAHQFTTSSPNFYDINYDGVVDIHDLILTWSHQFT